MQAYGQHPRRMRAFPPKAVERVGDISGKILAADEPIRVLEVHVVGVKAVWQHEVLLAGYFREVREVVVVGVAVVEKPAVLDEKPPGRARRS